MDDQNNLTPVIPVVPLVTPLMPEVPIPVPPIAPTQPLPVTASPIPNAPEPEWPGSKPKGKLPQILGGIAAIILVVGVATAAYFVSNRISGRQAVAPTAPESEPLAAKKPPTDGCKGKCSAKEYCDDGRCRNKEAPPPPYSCNETNCPAPDFYCSSSTNCVRKNKPEPTETPAPTGSVCTEGATSCADNHKYVCRSNKWIADGPCVTATGTPPPMVTCPNPKVCADGTRVDLCRQSCPIVAPTGSIVPTKPTVKPTKTPTKPPGNRCTEQCPGSDGVLRSCTPPEDDGSSNDSLCNLAGRVESCGNKPYCCPSAGGAWTTDMTACPTTPTPTLTPTPTPTPTLTPTPVAGACMEVALFAKICQPAVPGGVTCMAEGYQTTPMTAAQRASLRVGYKIRIAITGSKADLKARFRVLIDGVVEEPEWKLGQESSGVGKGYSEADAKTMWYSDYEIKKSGNYKFEGQVTTEP